MSFFGKKFQKVREENLDKLIAATQSNDLKLVADSVTSFSDNGGGSYTFHMEGDFGKFDQAFKSGDELDQPSRDGVVQKIKYTVDGNVIRQVTNKQGKVTTFVREFDGNKLKLTITVSGSDITAVVYQEAK